MSSCRQKLNIVLLLPVLLLLLVGCSNNTGLLVNKDDIQLADQSPKLRIDKEITIVQISHFLLTPKVSEQDKAILYFERGVLYDSLGLWTLARLDFLQAVVINPKIAEIYNYLGIYSLLDEEYDSALDAFNALLDLRLDYEYTYLNRGFVFYYTDRNHLAKEDFEKSYLSNKSDPYRVLWLYFNDLKLNPAQAYSNLTERAKALSNDYWGTYIVNYFLKKISLTQLIRQMQSFAKSDPLKYAEVLTETYFYIAKLKLNAGQAEEAATLFKLAAANQVYNFVEYRFALFELSRLLDNQTN